MKICRGTSGRRSPGAIAIEPSSPGPSSLLLLPAPLTRSALRKRASSQVQARSPDQAPTRAAAPSSRPCRRVCPKLREVALARRVAADEQQVVAIDAAEHAGAPRRLRRRLAAHAGLDRSRHDLPQRRIAGQRVRQLARLRRIGAAELDRGRRPATFVVAGVELQRPARVPVDAERRVEARERMVAVERRRVGRAAQRVAVGDRRPVVARGGGDVPVGRQADAVRGEDARRARSRGEAHARLRGADAGAAGEEFVDCLDAAVGAQESRLRRLREVRSAGVERGADDDLVHGGRELQRARRLRRHAALRLRAAAAAQHAVAGEVGVGALQRPRDAEQRRERRFRRIDGRGRRDARRGERSAVRGAQCVQRLVERVVGEVAVERARRDATDVDLAREAPASFDVVRRRQAQQAGAVARLVGSRVDARLALREQLRILKAIAVQRRRRAARAQRQVGRARTPAELAERLDQPGRRIVAPAAVAKDVRGAEPREAALVPAAALDLELLAAVRAGGQLHRAAGVGRAVLGLHRNCAAERVEPEQRIRARHERDRGDRRGRQQVPADDVAERLVEANAVDVERQALRRAEQRRGGVAAEAHVGLEGVALDLVDVHAAEAPVHELAERERPALFDLGARGRLHRRRHAVLRQVEAGQRCDADDAHRRQRRRRGLVGPCRRGEQRAAEAERRDHGRSPARPAAPVRSASCERMSGGATVAATSHRMATPHGSLPTAMSAIFSLRSVSITETTPERPQAT